MDISELYALIVFNLIGIETIRCPFDATKLQYLVSTKKYHFRPISESYRFFLIHPVLSKKYQSSSSFGSKKEFIDKESTYISSEYMRCPLVIFLY